MGHGYQGLRDWSIQRLTAIYSAIYIVLMFAYLAFHPHLHYAVWKHAFSVYWIQIPSLIFLIAMLWHAWIGVWTIFTDYVHDSTIRIILNALVILAVLVCFFWGVAIIWNIPLIWSF